MAINTRMYLWVVQFFLAYLLLVDQILRLLTLKRKKIYFKGKESDRETLEFTRIIKLLGH